MARNSDIQLRGICQCCGRQQAVTSGRMAKHGYTVEHGWFSGVCSGNHYAPVQHSREQLDAIVTAVMAQAADLRAKAAALEAGTIRPTHAKSGKRVQVEKADSYGRTRKNWEDEIVPFAQAPEWAQEDAVRAAAFNATRRAEVGESFCRDMLRIANEYHGKPLLEVAKAAGPERINAGEQRKAPRGVLTVRYVDGARVYWKDAKGYQGWTGSQAWRKLEKVGA